MLNTSMKKIKIPDGISCYLLTAPPSLTQSFIVSHVGDSLMRNPSGVHAKLLECSQVVSYITVNSKSDFIFVKDGLTLESEALQ